MPNVDAPLFPDDLSGQRAIELGCRTGYVPAWMARRGAIVTAVDNSANQLATCRRLQAEHNLDFATLHGNAETLPFADATFDFAISEYGAAIWADPHRWILEAYRFDWRSLEIYPGGVEFNLTISAGVRLFAKTGFTIEDYLELAAPAHAAGAPYGVSAKWAHSYPSEQVWILRKQK